MVQSKVSVEVEDFSSSDSLRNLKRTDTNDMSLTKVHIILRVTNKRKRDRSVRTLL